MAIETPVLSAEQRHRSSLRRRLAGVGLLFGATVLGIVLHTVIVFQGQTRDGIIADLIGRLQMLHQQHMKQIVLASQGYDADYAGTGGLISETLNALLRGGTLVLRSGGEGQVIVPPAPSDALRRKLGEQSERAQEFATLADRFLALPREAPDYAATLSALLVLNESLQRTSDEAVQVFNADSRSNLYAKITWQLAVALLVGLLGFVLMQRIMRANRELESEIAERKLAQGAMHAQEERVRSILNSTADGIITMNEGGTVQSFNPAAEAMFGYESGEVIGRDVSMLTPAPYREEHRDYVARYVRTGEARILGSERELIGLRKDGTTFPAAIRISEMADGQDRLFIGIVRDVSERKQAEQEVQRTQVVLNSIIENLPDMVFVKDAKDLRFVRFNRAGEELLGYSREELIGKNDYDFFPKDEADFFWEKDREVLQGGRLVDIPEEPIKTRLKGMRFLHTKKVPILRDDGVPQYLLGISEDITEQKRAQEQLRFTQFAIDRAAVSACWVTSDARFVYVNEAACRSLGWTREELLSMTLFDIDPDYQADAWPETWASIKARGGLTFESRHRSKEGRLYPVEITASYLEFQGLEYICAFARDISERKQAEEALQEMNMALSKAMPAIAQMDPDGRFLSANPIYAGMLGYDQSEVAGLTWDMTVHPEDHPIALAAMETMHREGRAEFEARAIRRDGSMFYKHVMIVKKLGQTSGAVGHHCFMRDITERKRAEEAIRESQAKLHRIADAIPGAVYQYMLTPLGEQSFLYFSRGVEDILGLTARQAQEDFSRVWNLMYPQDVEGLWASIEESARTLKPWSYEFRVLLNGRTRWLRGSSVPELPRGDGSIVWNGIMVDITEQKESEEAFKSLHRQYQLLLESAGEGVYGLDLEGRAAFVNPAGANMLGYEPAELIGKPMHGTIHHTKGDGSTYETAECPIYAALKGGTVHDVDTEVLWRKDGTSFPAEYTSTPIREDGKLRGAVVTFRDITERRRGEEGLRRYERIVSSSRDLMAFLDRTYRYLAVNQSYAEAFGLATADILGRHVEEILGRDRFETILKPCLDRCLSGEQVQFKHWLDLPKPGLRYLEVQYSPFFEKPGDVNGIVVNVRDLTARQRTEEALRESQERYRVLYDDNPCMCFTVSPEGTVLSVNKFGAKQLGYSVAELVGQSVFAVFHTEDRPSIERHIATCMQDPTQVYHWEIRKVKKTGAVMWVKETARVVQDTNGTPVLLIVCEDITERRLTEERLRESEERTIAALRQSDALKSALLSSVSHELRTPLTAIKSMVSGLIGGELGKEAEIRQEFLEGIHREIDYLNRLVDNLLDMSKIEAGTFEPRREWHLPEDLVEGAIRRLGKPLQSRPLVVSISEDLPSIYVDGVEIQQVLVNLLDNAVKYSPAGTPIRLEVQADPGQIKVRVSNAGSGIPQEDLVRVFDRFYRVRSISERLVPGTGLGLAICKGIIEAHGGRIWAESTPGHDTTLAFVLPSGTHPGIALDMDNRIRSGHS